MMLLSLVSLLLALVSSSEGYNNSVACYGTCYTSFNVLRSDNGSNATLDLLNKLLRKVDLNTENLIYLAKQLKNIKATGIQAVDSSTDHESCSSCGPSPVLGSCEEILSRWPNSTTGFYRIATPTGGIRDIYCHMDSLCNTDGPWTRIAHLNMSYTTQGCPSGFRLYTQSGHRACGRPSSGNIPSIYFESFGKAYSKICGRVHGYRYSTTDGFRAGSNNINEVYVDGVSLTVGSPRRHVWTFVPAYASSVCPCFSTGNQHLQPSYVGQHYSCQVVADLYSFNTQLMWDGTGCSSTTCCSTASMPWFKREFQSTTRDSVELRSLCDQSTSDEDVLVANYEIYIQ